MIVVDQNKCVGCRACVDSCPIGAVDLIKITTSGMVSSVAIIDPALCGVCGVCIDRCPAMAVALQQNENENKESKSKLVS
ncbi:MAG: 4Fe-4S binding protein [Planctomycetaceae bacterium]|jgi:formate hydrogenlyase subunit 6/NADH:ubiquinone oxidoreductase subunit I|nr:4Fe-4S binding protein [Planctomycetaceae bacterium]